jgi:L-lysine 6-transaminase
MVRVLEELAIVDDEDLVAQIPAKAAHLTEGLHALARRAPAVLGQVRGLGVYQGFSLRDPAATATFVARARDEAGLFLLTAGPGVIRLRPPMDVTHADIDRLLAGLSTLL